MDYYYYFFLSAISYFLFFTVTDVSPIIIDEENGIVYSPAFKRSEYMAQRLKDMKDKRENLSPTGKCSSRWTAWWTDRLKTLQDLWKEANSWKCHCLSASQMAESPSPTRLKPSLGSSPSVLKLICKKTGCCYWYIDLQAMVVWYLSFLTQKVSLYIAKKGKGSVIEFRQDGLFSFFFFSQFFFLFSQIQDQHCFPRNSKSSQARFLFIMPDCIH